jgi:hypothetical protein
VGTVDQGFVPAPPGAVYPRLADLERYGEWWPRSRARRENGSVVLRLPGGPPAIASVRKVRPGIGLVIGLEGSRVGGSLEWYLEPFKDGTVVNAILELEAAGRRRTMRLRRGIREGLVALRRLEEPA